MADYYPYGRYLTVYDPQRREMVLTGRVPVRLHLQHHEVGEVELESRAEVEDFMRTRLAGVTDAMADDRENWDGRFVRAVREGQFLQAESGLPLDRIAQSKLRALLLGTGNDLMSASRVRRRQGWLIEWFWELGSILQLSGNAKAGKTFLLIDIIYTLLVPGWRHLGRWRSADDDVYEWGGVAPRSILPWRPIVLINLETKPEVIERLLEPLRGIRVWNDGRQFIARDLVKVYHLRRRGADFDLRDPVLFEKWRGELIDCIDCGDDFSPPSVLLVDNLTVVLRALRQDVQRHLSDLGEAVATLIESLDMDGGILVTHGTKDGENAYGGTLSAAWSDGELRYAKGSRSDSKRHYSFEPREGHAQPFDYLPVIRRAVDKRLLLPGFDPDVMPDVAAAWLSAEENDDDGASVTTNDEPATTGADAVPVGIEAWAVEEVEAALTEDWQYRTKIAGSGAQSYARIDALKHLERQGRVESRVPNNSRPEQTQWRRVSAAVSDDDETPDDDVLELDLTGV